MGEVEGEVEMTTCAACGLKLHKPKPEAVEKVRSQFPGFKTGQLCCFCYNEADSLSLILSHPEGVVVRLRAPSTRDGTHKNTWQTTKKFIYVRGVPPEGKRWDFVLARLVYANNRVIILKFSRFLASLEEEAMKITEKEGYEWL